MRYDDIDPMDIDPETNLPYANYSSPSLDTSFHDHEMDVDEPQVMFVTFSDDGKHIRKWSFEPFDGAIRFEPQPQRPEPTEDGEVTCTDSRGHKFVCSDENENVAYCERCGTGEY